MMRVRRGLLDRLFLGCSLVSVLGSTACWVVVGGEDKILVEGDDARGGRAGKPPSQGGAAGVGAGAGGSAGAGATSAAGEGGTGPSLGGSAGAGLVGGSSGNGGTGATGGTNPGQGGAGQSGAAGAFGGTGGSGGVGGGGTSAGQSGAGQGGAGAGQGGSGGIGGAGKAGAAGQAGSAGQGAAGGSGGSAGQAGAVQTGPGQFGCKVEPAKSSYPFCTNFSPAPDGWEQFMGCNSRPMMSGNTTLLWSVGQNSKCSAFLDATVPLTPKQVSLSLWVRAKEIAVADGEPALNFTTLTVGPSLDASIGVRQTRNGLGVITGNILVVSSTSLSTAQLDVGAFPLDTWHHVTVSLGFKDGKLVVGGGYGLTSADEIAKPSVETATSGASNGSVVVRLSFIQTQFVAGPTSIEVDDLYLH